MINSRKTGKEEGGRNSRKFFSSSSSIPALQKRKELWRSTGAESFPPEKLI